MLRLVNQLMTTLCLASASMLATPSPVLAAQAKAATDLQQQVWQAEQHFAHSMATRDLTRFASFVADEAIFINGTTTLRGKNKVIGQWSTYFKDKVAPFSWQPDQVEVLDSGTLALSTGLVRDPQGKVVGRFNSIWRLDADGKWRVIFDKGSPASQAEQQNQSLCCSKNPVPGVGFRQIL